MIRFQIENIAFCEAIRQEIGGKHTLLGVTAGEVNISELPALIPVAVWISGKPESVGTFSISFRVLDVSKKEIVKGEVSGEFAGATRTALAFGPVPLNVERAGDYDFEWSFGENVWEKIGTYRINYVQN